VSFALAETKENRKGDGRMKSFKLKKIDAFTGNGSTGNPAACIYTDRELAIDDMQQIARELKGFVSEVVYCRPVTDRRDIDFSLLYYSSECEVDFCGHGTIACMYDVIKSDPALMERDKITIFTRKGSLQVQNKIKEEDSVFITAPKREEIGTDLSAEKISEALNIPPQSIETRFPVDLLNAGLNTLIVPIKTLDGILSINPPMELLRRFCKENGIDIITVWSKETAYRNHFIRTRVFAPKFGYLEDPATGSGNSAIGYYLLKNNLWQESMISIEQGPSRNTPNVVKLDTTTDEEGESRILFGGGATVRIEGNYMLA
jgi:PhzF family phenazine biosynthesis protein